VAAGEPLSCLQPQQLTPPLPGRGVPRCDPGAEQFQACGLIQLLHHTPGPHSRAWRNRTTGRTGVGLMGDSNTGSPPEDRELSVQGGPGGVVNLNCQQSGMTPPSTRHALSHFADAWSRVTGAAEWRRWWSRGRGGRSQANKRCSPPPRAGRVECRAPRLCRFVPNRVIRRRPNRVIGAGAVFVAGHGLHDGAGKRRHRPGARHLAACHEELPRPAAVGYTKLTGRTLRQRRRRLIPDRPDCRIDINRFA
jgi:hypothetical protein